MALSAKDSTILDAAAPEAALPDKGGKRYLLTLRGRGIGRPWMAVLGACVAMLGMGAQSSWGTMSIFISAPGLLRDAASTQTIWAYAAAGMMSPVSMMLAPLAHQRFGYAPTAAVGSVVCGSGLFLAGFARSLWALILTFGIIFGLGQGFVYVSCVIAAQSWYPKRRGVIGGLVLSMFAASAFMYNLLARALANPGGLATRPPEGEAEAEAWRQLFHAEMSRRVPYAFFTMGAMTAGLGVIGSALVHPDPSAQPQAQKKPAGYAAVAQAADEEKGVAMTDAKEMDKAPEMAVAGLNEMTPRLSSSEDENASTPAARDSTDVRLQVVPLVAGGASPAPAPETADISPLQMLRTPQFWMLYAVESFGITATLLVLGSFADFARREATFEAPFALVGGLAALSNAGGRLGWGAIADATDYRRTFVMVLTLVTGLLFSYYETRGNVFLWAVVTCLIWLCYGGLLALLPTTVADTFGTKYQSRNYSIIYTALALGSLVQALLLTALLEVLGSYRSLFYITGSLTLAANVLMIAYKPPGRGKWFALWISYKRV